MSTKLTPKRKKFCKEYVKYNNATTSAIQAGYSKKTARKQGSFLLTIVDIQEEIEKLEKAINEKLKMEAVDIRRELEIIADAKVTDYIKVSHGRVTYKDTEELTVHQQKAIASITETQHGIRVTLHSKPQALELLGRHAGMFKDKVEIGGTLNNPFEGLTTEDLRKLASDNEKE